jgi:hypothetical protein
MPKAFMCSGCGTRFSRRPRMEGSQRCPVCGRQAVRPIEPKRQPLIYWRVVGVATGTTALLIITLIFALKAGADSRRSAVPAPGTRNQRVLPAPLERQVEDPVPIPDAKRDPEAKPGSAIMEPARMKKDEGKKKEEALDAGGKTSRLVAAVANYAPSGFN